MNIEKDKIKKVNVPITLIIDEALAFERGIQPSVNISDIHLHGGNKQ